MNTATTSTKTAPELKSLLILGFLSLIWGSSFILIKKGLVVYSPVQLACLRVSISAIAFLPFFLYQLKKVDWSKWPYLLLIGLTGSAIPSLLFSYAQTEVSSSIAGILNSLTPLFTLILGVIIFGNKMIWSKLMGVLLGLVGAALLIILGKKAGLQGNLWYGLLIVLATICYATSVNTVGKYLKDMPSFMISTVSFTFVGIPMLFYLFTTDFVSVLQFEPGALEALGYISILSLGGTFLATIIFFQLVQWTNPVFSSTVAYIIPIVALLWGVLDGELISVYHLLAISLILGGVYLSRK